MKKQDQQQVDEKKQAHQHLKTLISDQVVQGLGLPSNLQSLQIRHLWTEHFRVNVLVGPDATSAKVAHSYFLMVGSDGNIITSIPKITRLY
jgi:hypothetical protein